MSRKFTNILYAVPTIMFFQNKNYVIINQSIHFMPILLYITRKFTRNIFNSNLSCAYPYVTIPILT